jgi:hypothetical protein
LKRKFFTEQDVSDFLADTRFQFGETVYEKCKDRIEKLSPEDDLSLDKILTEEVEANPNPFREAFLNAPDKPFDSP